MTRNLRFKSPIGVLALAAICVCFSAVAPAVAGTFNWGDLSDGGIMYLNVEETNTQANALFDMNPGSGSPDVIGDQIFFDPQNFQSQSSGGGADLIDSTLTTTLMAPTGKFIDNIQIDEFGDHSLGGLPGGAAIAEVGAAFFWTILEIDNLANPQPTQTQNMLFTTGGGPNGGEYDRPGDDGTAVLFDGSVFIDVAGYLAEQSIDGRATKVRLRFDNTLQTAADAVSNAFIKKKEINGIVITPNIPEPASIMLMLIALVLTAAAARARRV